MVVDIEKVIVKDRIRKDFGDIKELADDIGQNGLINPPVVNKNYELLAGERRLRACKLLGWKQIEVRMMDTRDAEHELEVEISENEVRKDFSKAERVDYAKRLERIESANARVRNEATRFGGSGNVSTADATGRTRDIVASKLGIGSGKQYEKEKYIVNHKGSLTPEDFAEWDEGRLSTNKAFRKIKERLEEQELRVKQLESIRVKDEDEIRDTNEKLKKKREELKKKREELEALNERISELQSQLDDAVDMAFERPEPERASNPMHELTEMIGKTEMDALISASRSGKVIVIENDMGGSVAELAAMMGIRTYEKGDIFTLTLSDE